MIEINRVKRYLTSYLHLLIAGFLAVVAINVFHVMNNEQQGSAATTVQSYFYLIVIALWIREDAGKRGIGFPSDLAMLNGYLAPLYLVHSRGWKGCGIVALIFVCFIGFGVFLALAQYAAP